MRYVIDNVPWSKSPESCFDYNNANFQALGYVLEVATGRRFAHLPFGEALEAAGGSRRRGLARPARRRCPHGRLHLRHSRRLDQGRAHVPARRTWNGRQLVSREYLREMRVPSPTEPRYGLGLWLAHNPYQLKEQEETFLSDGIHYLDGHSKQRVYMVPGQSLVIVRVGENGRGWDEAALVNSVLRGLLPPVDVSAESKTATSTRASTPEP